MFIMQVKGAIPQGNSFNVFLHSFNKYLSQLLTPGAIIFTGSKALFVAPDLLMLDTFHAQFCHVGVMSHPVSREFAFLFDEYVKCQAQHRQAEQKDRY